MAASCAAAKKLFFLVELTAEFVGQLFNEKSPGVVPCLLVLRSWITKTNDQFKYTHAGAPLAKKQNYSAASSPFSSLASSSASAAATREALTVTTAMLLPTNSTPFGALMSSMCRT